MITKTIQIQEITVDELADKVADKLLNKIKQYLDDLHSNESDVYLTRQETADFLKINITTLWHWTNKGKIKSYGIGNRRYYNKQEIIALLKKNELR
ncbi:helix-turn-helix domain-containing protein [Winogradskyella jejuensis]|uniref:Helix-turn-helix domain-containing protein n=1 Tax=Winogradskyella jejuensis TaxID=1089305 RepID=A0A1M5UXR5_9FLAO|nr:helix-turn-helix domain-containing protein [Winogradskyella jejuensis]SHH67706.1 Helix-turn-helix domain-containing protein [Winogradskyella jejuensis]